MSNELPSFWGWLGVFIVLCIFLVWTEWDAKRAGKEFKVRRVVFLFGLSILCASPFVLLSWVLWPPEMFMGKMAILMTFLAASFGPIFLLKPLGQKLTFDKPIARQPSTSGSNSREEIFDIVNERDEVVGQAPRSEVHRTGLLHRAVHVLVFNARGQLFLQKRSMTKDTAKGKWDSSSSGHVDSGEDYVVCAVREVWEEIGLKLAQPPERILRIEACAETGNEFVWVYRCASEGPFTLHPEEIERGDWFAPEEITRWATEKPQEFARAFVLIWGLVVNAKRGVSQKKN